MIEPVGRLCVPASELFNEIHMKHLTATLSLFAFTLLSNAQHVGNQAYEAPYSQYGYRHDQNRVPAMAMVYLPNDSVYQVQASVMINLVPDAYIVVYGVHQESATVAECSKQINSRIEKFKQALAGAGIPSTDVFVDMISQTRIYDYTIEGNTATQYKQGFEFKKNVIIRYKDNNMLERINLMAAEQEIFDIIKVDYIITDIEKIQDKLRTEAIKVIENKRQFMNNNSSLELKDKGIIQAESFNTVYPGDAYKKYTAFESSTTRPNYYNNQSWIKEQRKTTTFYFEKQHSGSFDKVINGDMVSVPVQMSISLSVKYYIPRPKRK